MIDEIWNPDMSLWLAKERIKTATDAAESRRRLQHLRRRPSRQRTRPTRNRHKVR